MPACTVASVTELLAAHLHKVSPDGGTTPATEQLAGYWTPLIQRAHGKAESWLRDTLDWAGEQAIARWRMFEHYHADLALFWLGVYGADFLTDDQKNLLRLLDCREEVKALESIGDDPDDETDDAVAGGRMSRDDDIFALPGMNADGSLPPSVFNTPAGSIWHWR